MLPPQAGQRQNTANRSPYHQHHPPSPAPQHLQNLRPPPPPPIQTRPTSTAVRMPPSSQRTPGPAVRPTAYHTPISRPTQQSPWAPPLPSPSTRRSASVAPTGYFRPTMNNSDAQPNIPRITTSNDLSYLPTSSQIDERAYGEQQYKDDSSSAQPRFHNQRGMKILDSYRPESHAGIAYESQNQLPIASQELQYDPQAFERVSSSQRVGAKEGGKQGFGKEILAKVHGIESRIMEDNLNLRDQLHDLHTGQRSLGTKDEIISGIWELLQPALQESFSNFENRININVAGIPERTANLVILQMRQIILEREELHKLEKAKQDDMKEPLTNLVAHLVSKLRPLDLLEEVMGHFNTLPGVLRSLHEAFEQRTPATPPVTPSVNNLDSKLLEGVFQIQTMIGALQAGLDKPEVSSTRIPTGPPQTPKSPLTTETDLPITPVHLEAISIIPELVELLKTLKPVIEGVNTRLSAHGLGGLGVGLRALNDQVRSLSTTLAIVKINADPASTPSELPHTSPLVQIHTPIPAELSAQTTSLRQEPEIMSISSSDRSNSSDLMMTIAKSKKSTSKSVEREGNSSSSPIMFTSPHNTRSKSLRKSQQSSNSQASVPADTKIKMEGDIPAWSQPEIFGSSEQDVFGPHQAVQEQTKKSRNSKVASLGKRKASTKGLSSVSKTLQDGHPAGHDSRVSTTHHTSLTRKISPEDNTDSRTVKKPKIAGTLPSSVSTIPFQSTSAPTHSSAKLSGEHSPDHDRVSPGDSTLSAISSSLRPDEGKAVLSPIPIKSSKNELEFDDLESDSEPVLIEDNLPLSNQNGTPSSSIKTKHPSTATTVNKPNTVFESAVNGFLARPDRHLELLKEKKGKLKTTQRKFAAFMDSSGSEPSASGTKGKNSTKGTPVKGTSSRKARDDRALFTPFSTPFSGQSDRET